MLGTAAHVVSIRHCKWSTDKRGSFMFTNSAFAMLFPFDHCTPHFEWELSMLKISEQKKLNNQYIINVLVQVVEYCSWNNFCWKFIMQWRMHIWQLEEAVDTWRRWNKNTNWSSERINLMFRMFDRCIPIFCHCLSHPLLFWGGPRQRKPDWVSKDLKAFSNDISMISVFTLTNINAKLIEGKLSKIFISEVCMKLVALRINRYTRSSSQLAISKWLVMPAHRFCYYQGKPLGVLLEKAVHNFAVTGGSLVQTLHCYKKTVSHSGFLVVNLLTRQ